MDSTAEQDDLLNFFNKKDKLKTVSVPAKKPAPAVPKKEAPPVETKSVEAPVPKVEPKPGKLVQDLRSLKYGNIYYATKE